MSGLGKAVKGPVTQAFGRPAVNAEPRACLQRDAGGWLRTRFAAFKGGTTYTDVHMGIDIAAAKGSPVLAREAGIIRAHGHDDARGLFVILEIRPGTVTEDQHLSGFVAAVGSKVKRGQVIAKVGSSGLSSGPHDHSQVCHHPTDRDWRNWRKWFAYNPARLETGGDMDNVGWIKPL